MKHDLAGALDWLRAYWLSRRLYRRGWRVHLTNWGTGRDGWSAYCVQIGDERGPLRTAWHDGDSAFAALRAAAQDARRGIWHAEGA